MKIECFTFSPFSENTYVLYDETKECVIVDPGCYDDAERNQLKSFIEQNDLKPVKLLNTHCHIDHVFGNKWVAKTYNLKPHFHKLEMQMLEHVPRSAEIYNMQYEASPTDVIYIDEGDQIQFGNTTLDILFVPGHSPGHVAFVNKTQKKIINGDVLFRESIGRTDLPLGDHETLLKSIREKLFVLDDDYIIYSGHTDPTTIGHEKQFNPFLG